MNFGTIFCGGVHLAIENCARILRLKGAFNNYVVKKKAEGCQQKVQGGQGR